MVLRDLRSELLVPANLRSKPFSTSMSWISVVVCLEMSMTSLLPSSCVMVSEGDFPGFQVIFNPS